MIGGRGRSTGQGDGKDIKRSRSSKRKANIVRSKEAIGFRLFLPK